MTRRIGILGGTFDPIHLGHVETALVSLRALGLERVLLVPSHVPPHRRTQPVASAWHRFAMTALAASDHPSLFASDRELRAGGQSYTARTLQELVAAGTPALQFFFITGADAFAEIATWYHYPRVLDLCHFVVVSRPGHAARDLPRLLPALADRMILHETAVGPAADLTSPRILLVDAVTPAVSATTVRDRAAAGRSIAGLVPDRVAAHILKHALYRAPAAADLQEQP